MRVSGTGPGGGFVATETTGPKIFTVSELTEEIRYLLEGQFDFVWVEGEISNFSAPASGHYYMVLKDDTAQIRAVMFRLQARYLRFLPEDGMKVIAQGRMGVYGPRGTYQIVLDYLEPLGVGALAMAFEQVKEKLAAQGIFDEKAKKRLPFLPQRVAVITSPTGAAVRDFLKIIHRRFVNIEVIVVPVRVQGEEAAADMVKALSLVNRSLQVDVIVLTRGGGSLEDLWAFNQEELALAIRGSRIPVLSAVGHEIDTTIADLAADFRAPTPSAAAELLVVEKTALLERLKESRNRLVSGMRLALKQETRRLEHLSKALRDPRKGLSDMWMRLDEHHARLVRLIQAVISDQKRRLRIEVRALSLGSPAKDIAALEEQCRVMTQSLLAAMKRRLGDQHRDLSYLGKSLSDLSPLSVLKRGYSIVMRLPEKGLLTQASQVERGDKIRVVLFEGELVGHIEEVLPGDKGL